MSMSMIWTLLRVHHFGKRFVKAITKSEMINVIALKTKNIVLLPAPLIFLNDGYLLLRINKANQTISSRASTLIKKTLSDRQKSVHKFQILLSLRIWHEVNDVLSLLLISLQLYIEKEAVG